MISKILKYGPFQSLSAASVFALIALHTQYLDIKTYGALAVLLASLDIARGFCSQWLSSTLIRLYPTCAEKERLIGASITGVWILLIPGIAGLALGLSILSPPTIQTLSLVAYILISKSLFLHLLEVNRVLDKARLYQRLISLQALLSVTFTWFFLQVSANLLAALCALALSYSIPLLFLCRNQPTWFDWKTAKSILAYGVPIFIAGNITLFNTRLDRLFISQKLDFANVGYYSAVSGLILGIMALTFAIVTLPIYPELAKASKCKSELGHLHAKYLDALLAVSLPVSAGLCIVSQPLLGMILPNEYLHQGAKIFWILSAAAFTLNIRAHYLDHGLQFLYLTKFLPLISAIELLLNFILLLFCIELFDLEGAAWAALLSSFASAVITFFVARKYGYIFKLGRNATKVATATITMALTAIVSKYLVPQNTNLLSVISIATPGIISYVLVLFMLNAFDLQQKVKKLSIKKSQQ